MVHFYSVDGIFPHDYKLFFSNNYLDNVKSIAGDKVHYTSLGTEGDSNIIWQRIVPGIPFVSARSLVNFAKHYAEGDDFYFLSTSKGNEELLAQHKEKFGDDVIANLSISFSSFKPKLDSCGELVGTDMIQVYSMDPAGKLPAMVTDKLM